MARVNQTKLLGMERRKHERRTMPSVTKKSIKDKIEKMMKKNK